MRDRLLMVLYDASGTKQLEDQLLVPTFVKRLCSLEVRYHNTLTCEDDNESVEWSGIW